jgi:hypothetical protein
MASSALDIENELFQPNLYRAIDPMEFAYQMWPANMVRFYPKQEEIIYSVENNFETFVHAGNMLGKDFVAGHIALSYFLRYPVVRIITTSVRDKHLDVLWAEIHRCIETCRFPLLSTQGGPLYLKHRNITKYRGGVRCPVSYMQGMVSDKQEGLAGHHAPFTLAILDEASGVSDEAYTQVQTWAKRILVIGNPMNCNGFFYRCCKQGNILDI